MGCVDQLPVADTAPSSPAKTTAGALQRTHYGRARALSNIAACSGVCLLEDLPKHKACDPGQRPVSLQ